MNIEGMAGPLMNSMTGVDPALAGIDRWGEDRWEALETELKDGAGSKRTSDRIVPQKENTRPVSGARDGNWINRRRGWIK